MTLSVLAFSPVITFFLTNYGGEATYRVYFFSVPWVALLAASAIAREPSAEPAERSARRRLMTVLPVGVVLVTLTALILPAYFGNDELYLIPPGEVTAADYFYTHAPVGSALVLAAEDFPSQISGRYNLYPDNQTDPDPTLLDYPQLGDYHQLGKQSLPAVAADLRQFSDGDRHDVFVAFAASGFAAARGYNLAPPGALEKLEAAMSQSPQWSVFYRNPTTTIFLYHPQVTGRS
jgi:hypothetical protein